MYGAMVSHDQSSTIKQSMPRYETDLHFANSNQEDWNEFCAFDQIQELYYVHIVNE